MLLDLRQELEDRAIEEFAARFGCKKDDVGFLFEIRILSLWLVVISLSNKKLQMGLHLAFCKQLQLDDKVTEVFLRDLGKRYIVFNREFEKWQPAGDGAVEGPLDDGRFGAALLQVVRDKRVGELTSGLHPFNSFEGIESEMVFMTLYLTSRRSVSYLTRNYKSDAL